MKRKLLFYIGISVLGLAFVASAAAQTLEWSPAEKFDDGTDTAIAVHPSGLILEFHRTHNGGNSLWYHLGKVNGTNVTWGESQSLPDHGNWPNVAITREGHVLFVWSTGAIKSGSDLYYKVGKLDPNGDVNQTISWLTERTRWDSGFHSSIALNDKGVIVGVHESGSGGVGLYYRVGHFADPGLGDFNIVWDSGEWGINYDDGVGLPSRF